MVPGEFRLGYRECLELLGERLTQAGKAGVPLPIQLLTGPRQVGKTTLLLALAERHGKRALYVACDAPEAALPGYWERLWARAEALAETEGDALLLLDEVHVLSDWAAMLKAAWDRLKRKRLSLHIVATGSSALRLATGSRESLAGRFERLTLSHWTASALVDAFDMDPSRAAEAIVQRGAYPGARALEGDPRRWAAYVHDAILEPAIGRDILALAPVRKPALLRQVFAVAVASPAQIVSLQKLQGRLQDAGSLSTIAYYLSLLEEGYLIAALDRHSTRVARRRSAPPKLVVLSNALLNVTDPEGPPDPEREPARFGAWLENACLAHACNAGQRVHYWREEPLEVDAVIDGSWGKWAIEVKTGPVQTLDLKGLLEFHRRFPGYEPALIATEVARKTAERVGIRFVPWRDYLLRGLGGDAARDVAG
jgi:predicted AAA+ superfamily ATPase